MRQLLRQFAGSGETSLASNSKIVVPTDSSLVNVTEIGGELRNAEST